VLFAFIQTLRENEPESRDKNLKCKWVPVIQLELEVIFNFSEDPKEKQILGKYISTAVGQIWSRSGLRDPCLNLVKIIIVIF
jgi:hypothetical protein